MLGVCVFIATLNVDLHSGQLLDGTNRSTCRQ